MYTDADRIAYALSTTGWMEQELPKARLTEYADAATQEVDSKVRLVYTVPLGDTPADVPPLVTRIATALATYQATLDWYGSTDIDDKDPVVRRWKWASDLLESVRKGETSLGLPSIDSTDDSDEDEAVVNPEYSGLLLPSFFEDLDRAPGTFGGWDQSRVYGNL